MHDDSGGLANFITVDDDAVSRHVLARNENCSRARLNGIYFAMQAGDDYVWDDVRASGGDQE